MYKECPLCGNQEKTQEETEIEIRQKANEVCEEFIKGRRSVSILSKRENEIIDCILDLKMNFEQAANNFGINKKTIYTYWDRAIEKVSNL